MMNIDPKALPLPAASAEDSDLQSFDAKPLKTYRPKVVTKEDEKVFNEQQKAREEELAGRYTWGEVVSTAISTRQIAPLLATTLSDMGAPELEDDPKFSLTDEHEQVIRQLPEQYWGRFVPSEVRSEGQFQRMLASIEQEQGVREVLQSKGVIPGLAVEIGAELLDPSAWMIAGATEGVLAPYIFTTKATRIGRAVQTGLLSAASTAPIEAGLAGLRDDYTATDALISTLAAGTLGGALGYTFARDVDKPLEDLRIHLQAEEARQLGATATPEGVPFYGQYANPDGTFKAPEEVNEAAAKRFFDVNTGHKTAFAKARVDRASDVFSSESAKVRSLGGALFEDPAAAKGELVGESAALWKSRTYGRMAQYFLRSRKTNFDAFKKERKLGWMGGRQALDEFNEAVTRVLRGGESDSAAVRAHAAEVRKLYQEMGELARNPGDAPGMGKPVKGSENMVIDDYVNRVWHAGKIEAAIIKAGDPTVVYRRIAKAMRGVDPDTAMKLAEQVVKVTLRSRQGGISLRGLRDSGENLELFLRREHGLSDTDAADIAASLRRLTGGEDAGNMSNLKSRLDIDESQLEDLFDNDIDSLFLAYANRMTGHIALARQGIDSEATFERLLQEAIEEIQSTPVKGRVDKDRRERAIRNLREAYDHLVGRPTAELNPNALPNTIARLFRKLMTTRLMNMVGFAQLAEFGVLASHVGVVTMLRNIPEFNRFRSRIRNGEFSDELVEELSGLMGGWADYRLLHRSSQRVEDFGTADGNLREGFLSKTERALDKMNEVTMDISGFQYVNQVLQSIAMKGMAQSFLDAARSGKRHRLSDARLRELGIDDATFKAIKAEMMKKGGASWSSTGQLKRLNLESWDPVTRAKFGNALRRWGNTVIQEGDFGSGMRMAETAVGKVVFQFKSFLMGSWTKQVLNNVKHSDAIAGMMLLNATWAGSMSYMLYVAASSVGRPDAEEYREEMLTAEKIALGAFQRSSISAFFPNLIDTSAETLFGIDPLFDTRASGTASNLILGNPTVDFANKAYTFLQEMGEVARGEGVDQTTVRSGTALLPFQNALGIRNFLNALVGELPRDVPY